MISLLFTVLIVLICLPWLCATVAYLFYLVISAIAAPVELLNEYFSQNKKDKKLNWFIFLSALFCICWTLVRGTLLIPFSDPFSPSWEPPSLSGFFLFCGAPTGTRSVTTGTLNFCEHSPTLTFSLNEKLVSSFIFQRENFFVCESLSSIKFTLPTYSLNLN